jgi:demethylmenaquinone methyltransferase/2-methoxy-6-polyprenyl-1,4-benzoquinol methylase
MLMYGWMKFVEMAPERYDWAVKLMTAGRLDKLKDRIASFVNPGDRVLDIGCGTGTLALRLLRRGARVTGLDMSEHMIQVARQYADKEQLGANLELIKDSVTQLRKHAQPGAFDCIVCTMVLGELSSDYVKFVFDECFTLLRPGGKLLIGDEVWPENPLARTAYRAILALSWVPQFLLLRRVNYPVTNMKQLIIESGFKINQIESWLLTSFSLIAATKPASLPTGDPSFSREQVLVQ